MKLLVTGGAGFIGSNFIRYFLARHNGSQIVNFDKLTYAGNLENLSSVSQLPSYRFVRGDIADPVAVNQVMTEGFDVAINFAAETHVDRSIEDAAPFLRTNISGTHTLLEAVRRLKVPLFVHISTDEVYGSAAPGKEFDEDSPLTAGSPYAASKAAADLLVQSYANTYGVRAVILRCTNNYGPNQFPEKFLPLLIARALEDTSIPVYGDGKHERDWLYVEDYCAAIESAIDHGSPGEIYNVSAGLPQANLDVTRLILQIMGKPESLIQFVEDRPGHDRRYALNSSKARQTLGWKPMVSFEEGIRKTIEWYKNNKNWLDQTRSGAYREYYDRHYLHRAESMQSIRQ